MAVLIVMGVILFAALLGFVLALRKADQYEPPVNPEVYVDEEPLLLSDPLPAETIDTTHVGYVEEPQAPVESPADAPVAKPKRTRKKKTSTEA